MPVDVAILVVTALLAAVAVVAAVVAVRALREVRGLGATVAEAPSTDLVAPEPVAPPPAVVRPVEVVDGRVVAHLTRDDLVQARLSRPGARLSVVAHGVAHALRPESRDRIVALVRREYRRRRALRLKVARRALRSVPPETMQRADWLGTDDTPRLAERPRAVGE